MTRLEEIKERGRNYILNRQDNFHLQSLLAQNIIDKKWLIEKLEEAVKVAKYYSTPISEGGCWDPNFRCVGSIHDDSGQSWSRFAMGNKAREFLEGLK